MPKVKTSPAGGTRVKRTPPRFLALGGGNGHGYTTSPLRECPVVADECEMVDRIRDASSLRDEPECIGPAILTSYADVNRRLFDQQHVLDVADAVERRPTIDPHDRLRDIERRAKYAHRDLTGDTRLIRMWLDTAKTGGRKPPAKALTRIQRLEASLDGIELAA